MKNNLTLRALTEGAIFTAAAVILNMLTLYKLPQDGEVCLGMLPVFIYCARWGFKPGLLVSFCFGLLYMILSGGAAWGWQSILGDYLVAFTVLGVAGLFRGQKNGFFTGTVVGSLTRLLVHVVVGATVWAEYMPEVFYNMTMTSPWIYSLLYNGSFMLIDMVLCLLVGALLWKPLGKYIRGEDLKQA